MPICTIGRIDEVEDVAVVDGITEDDMDDVEEDVVGDNQVPMEIQCVCCSNHASGSNGGGGQHLNCNRCKFHP